MIRPYTEYQQSDISWLGKVPKHWTKSKFKFLLNEKTKTQNLELPCGSISFGRVVFKDSERLSEETKAAYQEVLSGEFLVNPLNLNYDLKSLRTALADIDVIVSSGYIVLKSLDVVDKEYLKWLLYLFDVRHMKTLGAGIRQTISFKDIADCAVYIPGDTEQKAIATFLDRETQRIDNLIEEKQTFIKLLKEKRQALISHVVTKGLNPDVEMKDSGIEWIGQVPKHWVVKKIKYDVLGIEQGWSPQCESTPVPDDQTWGVVKVGCVNRGIFNPEQNKKLPEELEPRKEYTIKKGDLLVSRANAKEWVGSAAVPDRDYDNLLLCDKIYRIKLDLEKADPEFFAYYLASDQAREQIEIDATGTSSSMLNIGQGTILNMPIPAPELPEQQSIVQGLKNKTSQIDRLVLEVLDSIELLKEHRTSMISAAVTGKIDVREAV
ncbi:restriction endonuclease subunit S [Dickeya dadantii]|uniref:restriction endonuclease subunit S n=1 Tax=Dickeya dadantii TaxID=204038 RepID=UPI00149585F5|nr:restriction endonuclease subunit S [Dickeya dadantii]NPE54517.1 restriction endonuclease subunit S [Dickeya dadantii]NPE66522.1 restriction endonuclease subunit S [Dickeya dadantii]